MFKKKIVLLAIAGLLSFSALMAACGDPTSTPIPVATTARPNTAAAGATAAGTASTAQIASDMAGLLTQLGKVTTALAKNDVKDAQAQFKTYDENWDKVEDNVKARSPEAYKDIESKMDAFEEAIVKPTTPDVAKGQQALKDLVDSITKFSATLK